MYLHCPLCSQTREHVRLCCCVCVRACVWVCVWSRLPYWLPVPGTSAFLAGWACPHNHCCHWEHPNSYLVSFRPVLCRVLLSCLVLIDFFPFFFLSFPGRVNSWMLQEQRIYQLQTKHRETQADLEQKPGQLQRLRQYLVARQSAAGSLPGAMRQEMTQSLRSGKFPHFWKVRQMITKSFLTQESRQHFCWFQLMS